VSRLLPLYPYYVHFPLRVLSSEWPGSDYQHRTVAPVVSGNLSEADTGQALESRSQSVLRPFPLVCLTCSPVGTFSASPRSDTFSDGAHPRSLRVGFLRSAGPRRSCRIWPPSRALSFLSRSVSDDTQSTLNPPDTHFVCSDDVVPGLPFVLVSRAGWLFLSCCCFPARLASERPTCAHFLLELREQRRRGGRARPSGGEYGSEAGANVPAGAHTGADRLPERLSACHLRGNAVESWSGGR
jgi:hypothetical protein